MTPVARIGGSGQWSRLRGPVAFVETPANEPANAVEPSEQAAAAAGTTSGSSQLTFSYRFPAAAEEVFFAFCYPHSYAELQQYLEGQCFCKYQCAQRAIASAV
jgi:hypothetical protein